MLFNLSQLLITFIVYVLLSAFQFRGVDSKGKVMDEVVSLGISLPMKVFVRVSSGSMILNQLALNQLGNLDLFYLKN